MLLRHAQVAVCGLELAQRLEHALPLVLLYIPHEANGIELAAIWRRVVGRARSSSAAPNDIDAVSEWEVGVPVRGTRVSGRHAQVAVCGPEGAQRREHALPLVLMRIPHESKSASSSRRYGVGSAAVPVNVSPARMWLTRSPSGKSASPSEAHLCFCGTRRWP